MKNIKIYISLVLFVFLFSCDNEQIENEVDLSNFISKVYDQDTILIGKILENSDSLFLNLPKSHTVDTIVIKEIKKEIVYGNSNKFNSTKEDSYKILENDLVTIVSDKYVNFSKDVNKNINIVVERNSNIHQFTIEGDNEDLNESNELIINFDNSANKYNKTFIAQLYDANNGTSFNLNQYNISVNQTVNKNITRIMVTGLSAFGTNGFRLELR
jgi:hypothetical protein